MAAWHEVKAESTVAPALKALKGDRMISSLLDMQIIHGKKRGCDGPTEEGV